MYNTREVKIGVYSIISPTGRIYIGSSKNIYNRWKSYERLTCKSQAKLYNSLLKYGVKNHEFKIIIECEIDELHQYENLYSNYYNSLSENNLNLRIPSYLEDKPVVAKEAIKKMVANHAWKNNPEFIEKYRYRLAEISKSPEIQEKMRANHLIGVRSESAKNKFKQTMNAKTEEWKKQRLEKMKQTMITKNNGSYHSKEFKENLSKRLKGGKLSIEHRAKMKENSGQAKKVIDTNTEIIYNSIKDASIALNTDYCSLVKKLTGQRKNKTSLKFL